MVRGTLKAKLMAYFVVRLHTLYGCTVRATEVVIVATVKFGSSMGSS